MVDVVDYQPSWPSHFETLQGEFARAFESTRASYRRTEHVSSTAVPDLAAKPAIGVAIVVYEADIAAATAALVRIGFGARGYLGIIDRYAFVTPARFTPSNVYAVVDDSLPLRNHLAARDVLRSDATLRTEYDKVNRRAAATASTIDEYVVLNADVLGRILERAGLSEADRTAIAVTNRRIIDRGVKGCRDSSLSYARGATNGTDGGRQSVRPFLQN
jgi:GrpB-like predicted nucleotidyltransferase (UPF0157 family)